MKSTLAMAALLAFAAAAPSQQPSSAFDRGNSLQASQDARLDSVTAKCRVPPKPRPPLGGTRTTSTESPPIPELPRPEAIPGVLAAGQSWKIIWSWEGNNVDGEIAGKHGSLLFANNDSSNVMQLDPETGLATILYDRTNTGGALSRSRNGNLFIAVRGIGGGIDQLAPTRRIFANTYQGEPLECLGGIVNDIMADARGGVYLALSFSGVFYADPQGVLTKYSDIGGANGILLSADEKTLYVSNGDAVMAFDVQGDGSLQNQREFAKLRGGKGGDGLAIDAEGRLYAATNSSIDVFSRNGEFLGSIAGPRGLHGVVFAGKNKQTLFGIVFYGGWGTPTARNMIIALPALTRGYKGRAK